MSNKSTTSAAWFAFDIDLGAECYPIVSSGPDARTRTCSTRTALTEDIALSRFPQCESVALYGHARISAQPKPRARRRGRAGLAQKRVVGRGDRKACFAGPSAGRWTPQRCATSQRDTLIESTTP